MKASGGIAVPIVEGFVEAPEFVRERAGRRIRLLSVCILMVLAAMGVRGAQLCIHPDERIIAAGSTQRWEQMTFRASRGRILARDNRPLATSVNTPNVVVDPSLIDPQQVSALSLELAKILGEDAEVLAQLMSLKGRYAKLASRVHPEVAQAVLQLKHRAIFTETDSRRYYPERFLSSHALGYVSGEGLVRCKTR